MTQLPSSVTKLQFFIWLNRVPVDARTDSEKAAAFEFCLEHGSVSPAIELMNQVIQSPDKEHPDVQRMVG